MFSSEIKREALEQLSQAIYHHEHWHKNLIRAIICRLPYDPRDVAEDAHTRCRFGQWYYSSMVSREFHDYPAFLAVEAEHVRMHQLTAKLLQLTSNELPVSAADYDNFANSLDRFRLELFALKREIEDSLYRRDPLTGAENRIDMLPRLREMLEMVKGQVQQSSIILMDLDYFKEINDNYGHLIGDHVLIAVVRYIKEHLRPYDRVFRYGGEEFLIAMPDSSLELCQVVAERMREGLAETVLARSGETPIYVTASFGVVQLDPHLTIEESMERADKALYASKLAGRNCVRIWEA